MSEYLLSLLMPKTVNLDGGSVSVSSITPSMVAAALSGCSDPVYWLLMYIAGDESAYARVERLAFMASVALYQDEVRNEPRGLGICRLLSRIAIQDVAGDHTCPSCNGVKQIAHIKCEDCEGTGKAKFNWESYIQAGYIELCNKKGVEYRPARLRLWQGKYGDIYHKLGEWKSEGLSELSGNLG